MNSSNPLLSIICPVFNAKKFIRSTIDSILQQTFEDWELLLIDGASTDGSVDIMREYAKKDSRIKLFSENDEGPAHAIEKGLLKAKGMYICFMYASDGYVENGWFEKCARTFKENNDLSLVWGIPYCMSEDGAMLGPHFAYAQYVRGDNNESGSRWTSLLSIFKRLRAKSFKTILSKFSRQNVNLFSQIMTGKDIPQKDGWLLHWLATGALFPDANMWVRRSVFLSCYPRYQMGNKVVDYFFDFYFNFNSRGYMSMGLATPANYGRIHEGQNGVGFQERIDAMKVIYLRKINEFRERIINEKKGFMAFIDSEGNVVCEKRVV